MARTDCFFGGTMIGVLRFGPGFFLASTKVLNRDFIPYAEKISVGLWEHAEEMAERLK